MKGRPRQTLEGRSTTTGAPIVAASQRVESVSQANRRPIRGGDPTESADRPSGFPRAQPWTRERYLAPIAEEHAS